MKTAFLLLACVGLVAAGGVFRGRSEEEDRSRFGEFQTSYSKAYAHGDELEARFTVFRQSLDRIDRLNKESLAAGGEATFAMNQFSDMTSAEFSKMYLGYKPSNAPRDLAVLDDLPAATATSVDWRTKGAVTPVKNQGQCGSCWAFSTTEEIESMWFRAGNKLVSLSPQQIVSCDTHGSDQGCDGGDTVTAYAYVEKAGGLETEAAYPYKSGGGQDLQCKFKKSGIAAHINGFKYATSPSKRDEDQMASATETVGPLSICVDASTWQDYSSGIIKNNCGTQLDHCVQIVGYNKEGSTPYWIVRNSWTTTWGIDGYIHIEMGKDLCGIAMEATYATI